MEKWNAPEIKEMNINETAHGNGHGNGHGYDHGPGMGPGNGNGFGHHKPGDIFDEIIDSTDSLS